MFKEGDWVVVTKPEPDFTEFRGRVLMLTEVEERRLFARGTPPGKNYESLICMYNGEVEPATAVQILAAKLSGR